MSAPLAHRKRSARGLCACALLAATLASAAPHAVAREAYRLQAPVAVSALLRDNLPPTSVEEDAPDDEATRLGLIRRLRRDIPDLLATDGYFSPNVQIDASGNVLVVEVETGPRARIASVDISFEGDLASPANQQRAEALRKAWSLPIGAYFQQREWTLAKDGLVRGVTDRKYAAATLKESLADVDPAANEVHLYVVVDSGPTFTLGPLQVEGLDDYSVELVQRYNTLSVGEDYDYDKLLAFQSSLQNTPYFSAVEVSIDRDPSSPNNVPVKVQVSEGKPRRVTFGTGFSSNTGARAEVSYRDANWLSRAWQLDTGIRLEQKRQAAIADVFLPPRLTGHRDSFGGIVERSDIRNLKLTRQAIGVARSKTRGNIDTRIGVSYLRESRHAEGAPFARKQALAANWSWTQRKVDNVLDPRDGYVLNVQFGGASRALLSDANFVRSYLRLTTYWQLSQNNVLSLRGEAGHTAAKDRFGVPEEFLFRTGGSQSVRGYSYLSLGVQEGEATVGGRYLATGSAELTHWLNGQWGIAGFVDAGNAVDDMKNFRPKVGVGMGARWRSPAGPIAVDLAYGVQDKRIRPHISIAIAF